MKASSLFIVIIGLCISLSCSTPRTVLIHGVPGTEIYSFKKEKIGIIDASGKFIYTIPGGDLYKPVLFSKAPDSELFVPFALDYIPKKQAVDWEKWPWSGQDDLYGGYRYKKDQYTNNDIFKGIITRQEPYSNETSSASGTYIGNGEKYNVEFHGSYMTINNVRYECVEIKDGFSYYMDEKHDVAYRNDNMTHEIRVFPVLGFALNGWEWKGVEIRMVKSSD